MLMSLLETLNTRGLLPFSRVTIMTLLARAKRAFRLRDFLLDFDSKRIHVSFAAIRASLSFVHGFLMCCCFIFGAASNWLV